MFRDFFYKIFVYLLFIWFIFIDRIKKEEEKKRKIILFVYWEYWIFENLYVKLNLFSIILMYLFSVI